MQIPFLLLSLIWAIAAYAIYILLSTLLTYHHNTTTSRRLKCTDPPELKSHYPLGIDLLLRFIAADKAKLFPNDIIQRHKDVGASTYKFSILGTTFVTTADPKNIQAILATRFDDFDLGAVRRGNFWPLLGNGIFTMDGGGWLHSRSLMRPQFARDQVSDLTLEENHVQNLMSALDLASKPDKWIESIDLKILFFRLTLDSATEFLFGTSVDSQLDAFPSYRMLDSVGGAPKSSKFAAAFDDAQAALAMRSRFAGLYWLVWPKGFKENCRICHEFVDHFVRLALAKVPSPKTDTDGKPPTTTSKYIFLSALALQTRDPTELRTQSLNILLAGRDTTASLLSWLFLALSKDTARYLKLRTIVLSDFGTYDKPSGITFEKLKGCKYLQYCMNEALRLHPAVPVNARTANKDTVIPRGGGERGEEPVFVPRGGIVEYSVHAMHHREDLWGADAEIFNPERWEGRKTGWEYLPFNGGPRICLGQQFSLTEASYVTVRLLQRFDTMEYVGNNDVVRHDLGLTNCPADPVEIRMHAI